MNALTLTESVALTMSSREIAELTGKEHKNVIRDIRAMLDSLAEGDGSVLSHVAETKDARGYTAEIALPKDLTLTLVAGYNVKLRKRIIDRWLELEAQQSSPVPAIPQTLPEALRLAADLAEQKAKADAALAIAAPKVEGFDRIANATGLLSLRETATTLKVPERKFIAWMQRHDWLYRRPGKGTLLGYAERLKEGYLEHKAVTIHNDRTGEDEIREQVRVTPLGLTVLAKRAKDMQEVAA